MGILFSRFRSKPSTKELLEDLQKDIDGLEDYKHSTELQQKALIGSLVFYSCILYIIVAIIVFFFYFTYTTTKDLLIYCAPFIVFPFLVYIFKKFLQWYFLQKIRSNEENLSQLRKKKKALLEYAMETETYKVVKELLEKYDPVNHRKIFEAKPAIEAAPIRQPLRGSFSEMEIKRRNVSPKGSLPIPLGSSGQTISMNTYPGSPNVFPVLSGKPLTNPPYPTPFFPRGVQRFVRPPMPPTPRPVLPRERTLVDRIVDYLVGDGPSNRFALICRHCQSHNGMAHKEEFEYVSFRCCYCMQFNPARNQQPLQPRLTLPAPQPSAPIITEAPSEASNSSDEAEIENVSDIDCTSSVKPVEVSNGDVSPPHHSVTSEPEISTGASNEEELETTKDIEETLHELESKNKES